MPRRTRDPVVWVVGLFAANFLLQRISVPALSIPIIVPLAVLWVGSALYFGVVTINARRLLLWLAGAGISAALVIAQVLWVEGPYVSVTSWALWMTVWFPLVVHLTDRRPETYRRALRGISNVGLGIAALTLLFTGTQYVGIPYRDWLGQVVPSSLLVSGYVVSYPITYGSPIYKSNAWIGLEPSFVSFMLGICLVAAIIVRLHWWKVVTLALAMLATTAGSGLAIVIGFVGLSLLTGRAGSLRRYAIPAIGLGAVFATTLLGQSILDRVTEAGQSRSSTSLRMIEPYEFLWPHWLTDPVGMIVGRGPGSSAWIVNNSGIDGLLVPSVAKVVFDYGVIGGVILIALIASTFVRTPEPIFAAAIGVSMFTVQSASPGLVVCAFCVASLWSPAALRRRGRVARPVSRPDTAPHRSAAAPADAVAGSGSPSREAAPRGIAARTALAPIR